LWSAGRCWLGGGGLVVQDMIAGVVIAQGPTKLLLGGAGNGVDLALCSPYH
jgi:hypothetical protein